VNRGIVLAVAIAIAAPAVARAQTTAGPTAEQRRRNDKIFVMEGTLRASVELAAKQVTNEVQSTTPNATLFTGEARAKGFALDGYGVFFFVEIPALDLSVMLSVETFERAAQRRLDSQVNNSRQDSPQQVSNSNARQDPPQEPAAVPPLKEVLRSFTTGDPGQKYHDAVKLALIDAMLDNSKNLALQPDEWLTIAARGSEGGLLTNEILLLRTVVLRVKGSVLADFLAGRLTQEEAREKVEVRRF
jgi:hypothetical protein